MTESFSNRYGFRPDDVEITLREHAPVALRDAVVILAEQENMSPGEIRFVVCQVLLTTPDSGNWSQYPNIANEVYGLVSSCSWYKVYDIAEALYKRFDDEFESGVAENYQDRLNRVFIENGIGWEMQDGKVIFRGSGTFTPATKSAVDALESTGRVRAALEMKEAIRDISRRPDPDVTGAIQHAMAALESAARDVTGHSKETLGQVVRHLHLPAPLDTAVIKLWGYSSDRGRHVREGQTIGTSEAELVVTVAGAICTFITEADDSDPF